jgi:hypothetical protein
VPTQYGHRQVWVKGYVHQAVIACGSEVIARHPRSYERETVVFYPLHYLALLEQKTRALDQAAPMAGWQLPECFAQLRCLLKARLKKHGSREYVRLPTMLREYDKVARQCAVEQLDYQRYLLRVTELELLDRERRATERRIRQAKFPVVKTWTASTSWPYLP